VQDAAEHSSASSLDECHMCSWGCAAAAQHPVPAVIPAGGPGSAAQTEVSAAAVSHQQLLVVCCCSCCCCPAAANVFGPEEGNEDVYNGSGCRDVVGAVLGGCNGEQASIRCCQRSGGQLAATGSACLSGGLIFTGANQQRQDFAMAAATRQQPMHLCAPQLRSRCATLQTRSSC
jgi:hypothetical protein